MAISKINILFIINLKIIKYNFKNDDVIDDITCLVVFFKK